MLLIDVTPAMSFMVKPPALKTIALQGVETSNKNPFKFKRIHKNTPKQYEFNKGLKNDWNIYYRQHKCVAGCESDAKGKVDL